MMTEHMRRAFACAFGLAALALASGCNPATSVRVTLDGAPVPGAEVYANNLRIGVTDASGVLAFPRGLQNGVLLVARTQVHTLDGWRPHHDPGSPDHGGTGWIEHVYVTSMEITGDGVLRGQPVTNPATQQTLVLQRNNTLIGFHILVSVNWDASPAELNNLGEMFRQAGEYLYNATDGQMHFEQVDIVDDNAYRRDAEYHWNADHSTWPNCWSLRGLFVPNAFGSAVEMSRLSYNADGTDGRVTNSQTIAHEFGHLAFGLMDEYMPGSAFCATHVRDTDPLFGGGMPKASCVMDSQFNANKYCSSFSENPHTSGSLQAASCWSYIASTFADPSGRWALRTPDTRMAIVPRLQPAFPTPQPGATPQPGLPPQWQARINIDNRSSPGSASLCQPFSLPRSTWSDGSPGEGWLVVLDVGDRRIDEGATDRNGDVTIVGAHPGNRIWIGQFGPWKTVVATPSSGPNTCNAP